MSAQTTLTDDAPMILDATCSFRHTDHNRPNWPVHATIRIDIRAEVKPDMIMDNTNLKFADASIDKIYYDPPHVIRRAADLEWIKKFRAMRKREGRTSPAFFERFGYWESKNHFLQNIDGVNREFYRVLKPTGLLFCKISVENGHKTRCITIEDFLKRMSNFIVFKKRTTRSKSNLGKNIVYWLTMKPKPTGETA